MSADSDVRKALPYDDGDARPILGYAAKLTGHTLKDLLGQESGFIGGKDTKGYFGQLVEKGYFMIDNNSRPVPDFDKVGIELKVTPLKALKKGLTSKERLVLGIIDYNEVPSKRFRIFSDKNSHLLIVLRDDICKTLRPLSSPAPSPSKGEGGG